MSIGTEQTREERAQAAIKREFDVSDEKFRPEAKLGADLDFQAGEISGIIPCIEDELDVDFPIGAEFTVESTWGDVLQALKQAQGRIG